MHFKNVDHWAHAYCTRKLWTRLHCQKTVHNFFKSFSLLGLLRRRWITTFCHRNICLNLISISAFQQDRIIIPPVPQAWIQTFSLEISGPKWSYFVNFRCTCTGWSGPPIRAWALRLQPQKPHGLIRPRLSDCTDSMDSRDDMFMRG